MSTTDEPNKDQTIFDPIDTLLSAFEKALADVEFAVLRDVTKVEQAMADLKSTRAALRAAIAAALSEARAQGMDAALAAGGVIVSGFTIGDRRSLNAITVQRVGQIEGPDLWAVRRNSECLSIAGEWEWEPMPSSRDAEFLARCRFKTHIQAIDAAMSTDKEPAHEQAQNLR